MQNSITTLTNSPIRYKITNTELPRTLSVRYLGLHIDEKLCWSVYIKFPSVQVENYLGLLFRFREVFTTKTL